MLGSRDGGTPFLEAAETGPELKLRRDFPLRVHPGATTPQHSSPCSGGRGCMVRMPGLALVCWEGWCSVPVTLGVTSGSRNRFIDLVFCPVSKHQQINFFLNGQVEGSTVLQRRQSRKVRGMKEQNMESTWRQGSSRYCLSPSFMSA